MENAILDNLDYDVEQSTQIELEIESEDEDYEYENNKEVLLSYKDIDIIMNGNQNIIFAKK